ncbi:MAG TPA: MBL fold metallo-hydrolase [Candidatus Acidoferrales bacterium]|nr:MBL fold metallo-hydrolase [Candidatus Acidoferrales bacterium]
MQLAKFVVGALLGWGWVAMAIPGYGQAAIFEREPACRTLHPASAGGPMPANPDVMVLRWFGYASYEAAYRGKVILFDAYYDGSRPPTAATVGLTAADIQRADALFIGHAHFDHIEDAPAVTRKTGALIFVAPSGRPYLQQEGVPAARIHYVRGGETIPLPGYTVQTALAIHSQFDPGVVAKFHDAYAAASPPVTAEQQAWQARVRKLQPKLDPSDPEMDIIHRGTIAYALTFESGFRLVFRDSPGEISDGERKLAASLHANGGRVDLAILGYQGPGPSWVMTHVALPMVKLYNPRIFLPGHQDADGRFPALALTPLFLAFRDQMPTTRGIAPLYRSPICVDTKTDAFYVGDYVGFH